MGEFGDETLLCHDDGGGHITPCLYHNPKNCVPQKVDFEKAYISQLEPHDKFLLWRKIWTSILTDDLKYKNDRESQEFGRDRSWTGSRILGFWVILLGQRKTETFAQVSLLNFKWLIPEPSVGLLHLLPWQWAMVKEPLTMALQKLHAWSDDVTHKKW